MAEIDKLQDLFCKTFGNKAVVGATAPGRVNLIGEHTDYNDGFVLPMALPLRTLVIGRATDDKHCRVLTTAQVMGENNLVVFDVPTADCPVASGQPKWANYVKGVVANFSKRLDTGFEAIISSTVPLGGGLSSSASLEVAMYTFLEVLTGAKAKSDVSKALACQKAEHDFAGMPCGIMDQFISVMGKQDHALMIDCRSMTSKLIPFKDKHVAVLITNSNVKHELTGSEYPTRRRQCEKAAAELGVKSLRDASASDVESHAFSDEFIQKRARHVVGEIKRTTDAAEALEQGDYMVFGKLMKLSHASLRDDYEVSCKELDELVQLADSVDGVFGSRMTGGGFGGCTITLCREDALDAVKACITQGYSGIPTFYVCHPSCGTEAVEVKGI